MLVPFKPKKDDRSKGRHIRLYVYFKLNALVTRSNVVSKIKCRVLSFLSAGEGNKINPFCR